MRGALVVGQSGGATPVINASLVGVVRAAQSHGIARVLGLRFGILGLLEDATVELGTLDAATLAALAATPSAALGSARHRLAGDEVERALATLRRYDAHALLLIGGNDTAETAHTLAMAARAAGYELAVIGVPKTIDNDLPCTDHCPGYGSAARFVATALCDLDQDARAMRRVEPVRLFEVKGRNSGWLAAAAALGRTEPAAGPHIVAIPEHPLRLPEFLAAIEAAYRRYGYAVAVVPETARDEHGRLVGAGEAPFRDPFGHAYAEDVSGYLCRMIGRELGLRARYDRPNALHKTSSAHVSPVDRAEAEQVGAAAVAAALAGQSEQMVTLVREPGPVYRCTTGLAPLAAIAGRERVLPDAYFADGTITDAFRAYALPLLGGPLPRYPRLFA